MLQSKGVSFLNAALLPNYCRDWQKKVSDKVDQINKTELNFFLFFLDLLGIIECSTDNEAKQVYKWSI